MAVRNLPTLKGVFPQPKVPPKRDFLRENKLKVKDLQKHNNRKHLYSESDENSSRRSQRIRSSETRSSSVVPRRIDSGCSCVSKKTQSSIDCTKRISRSQVTLCDKNIQTDDISDEVFLSDALKRCFSKDDVDLVNNHNDAASHNYVGEDHNYNDNCGHSPHEDELNNHNNDDKFLDGVASSSEVDNVSIEDDQGSTIRSSQTTKRKLRNNALHEFGSKTDLKLPKYLEREKREKELERLREMERDPHCPKGHYVLDERERQEALMAAEKKFQELINELNRMPMSSETLRIRNRKMEIERALFELENNIRIFSKSKVYVKAEN